MLDQPNLRSSHTHPTPRSGGLVFVLISAASSFVFLIFSSFPSFLSSPFAYLPLLVLPLAVVGLLDDRFNLPAVWRYFVQLITAVLILFISPLTPAFSGLFGICVYVYALILVTASINFVNFMDGLDGLVAGCMEIALITAAIYLSVPSTIWALIGALFGFLVWNWSPAKVFMGDVGSTFLGALLSGLVLQASTWTEAFGLLLVATPLLADAGLCVPRRLLHRQRVFQAHRLHLFQRLHQAGWPHARVSSLYLFATAVLAFALLWGGFPWVIALAALELLLGIWLDQNVAVPFSVASRS